MVSCPGSSWHSGGGRRVPWPVPHGWSSPTEPGRLFRGHKRQLPLTCQTYDVFSSPGIHKAPESTPYPAPRILPSLAGGGGGGGDGRPPVQAASSGIPHSAAPSGAAPAPHRGPPRSGGLAPVTFSPRPAHGMGRVPRIGRAGRSPGVAGHAGWATGPRPWSIAPCLHPGGHQEERGQQVEGGHPRTSALPQGGPGWSTGSSSGLPGSRRTGNCWRGDSKGPPGPLGLCSPRQVQGHLWQLWEGVAPQPRARGDPTTHPAMACPHQLLLPPAPQPSPPTPAGPPAPWRSPPPSPGGQPALEGTTGCCGVSHRAGWPPEPLPAFPRHLAAKLMSPPPSSSLHHHPAHPRTPAALGRGGGGGPAMPGLTGSDGHGCAGAIPFGGGLTMLPVSGGIAPPCCTHSPGSLSQGQEEPWELGSAQVLPLPAGKGAQPRWLPARGPSSGRGGHGCRSQGLCARG
ncbi:collagen alpha-1(III) chain-like isoform X1 [Rissa tridactyla]|uniref:collagen alpha-1(III) chain-like isoform X1 n=1 Tax=Rissa tridactyla TaxID=75485 RepID=UPI0023BADF5B|nr:collagen alpha-1(III) chain-like isoform X1 [Rissa tridactyla]XP_054036736.1 collagen alpha-1(III) chain-like isoform X1 [Rissa tridactyla]XP_054036737.1 collagen alpha-1(III) chain-like isoform X1 [Rissa tridactyla]